MKTHLNATALRLLALGALTCSLFACADEDAQNTEAATGEQAEAITAKGIAVTGCGANAVFNVDTSASNFAKNVDFIALDQSDFAKLTSQLSSFDSQDHQQLVSNSADTLDSSLQKLVNDYTNEMTARQESQQWIKEHQAAKADTSLIETASHYDSTVVTTDTSNVAVSSHSGSASNRALQTAASSNFSIADARAFSNTSFNNSASNIAVGGGVVAPIVPIALGIAATSPFFSSAAYTTSSGSASNADKNLAKYSNSAFNLTASNNDNRYSDYVRQAASQHTATKEENQWSRTLQSSSSDAMSRDLFSQSAQAASQASAQRNADLSLAQSMRSTHVAFKDLSSLQAKNFQLNVNMQAADNQAHTLRVFVGQNDQITSSRNFAITFPGCVGLDP